MATLTELGKKYPCVTEGEEIAIDDTLATMQAGDVLEAQWVADRDITTSSAFDVLHEVLRLKEEYPYFVLHYIRVDSRRITIQYSVAPEGAAASPVIIALIWVIVKALGILIGIALIAYTIYTLIERQYIFRVKPPMGDAVIEAKHTTTEKGISGVKIYVDGALAGTTDGGSVLAEDLTAGSHLFSGEEIAGFHKPTAIEKNVIKDETVVIEIWYRPEDEVEPTTGFVVVDTDPVKGNIWVGGIDQGIAPVGPIELDIGTYMISFGLVEGWITPAADTATIVGGKTTGIVGKYTKPPSEETWYEKYVKYALIGGGVIIGTALLLPELIRALARRGEKRGQK